jgi:hypothetical protein
MLITKQTIQQYKQVSKSVSDDLINPHILEAEFLDLKPLLGEDLYADLVANTGDSKYIDLMEGKVYTCNGKNYSFNGLKSVLSNFAYARYVVFSSFIDTPFGLVTKSNQDSQPVGGSDKRMMGKAAEQAAYSYFNEVRDFLNRNTTIYDKWNVCDTKRVFKINKISI